MREHKAYKVQIEDLMIHYYDQEQAKQRLQMIVLIDILPEHIRLV